MSIKKILSRIHPGEFVNLQVSYAPDGKTICAVMLGTINQGVMRAPALLVGTADQVEAALMTAIDEQRSIPTPNRGLIDDAPNATNESSYSSNVVPDAQESITEEDAAEEEPAPVVSAMRPNPKAAQSAGNVAKPVMQQTIIASEEEEEEEVVVLGTVIPVTKPTAKAAKASAENELSAFETEE